MAVITPATDSSAQGIIRIVNFAAIGDGDTFAGPIGAKAVFAQLTADPTTNTSAGVNVAYVASTGVVTFYPGIAALSGTLFIIK